MTADDGIIQHRGFPAEVATWTLPMQATDRRNRAVVWGDLGATIGSRLVRALALHGPRARCADLPESQWATTLQRPDGSVLATASTTLPAGLFWSIDSVDDRVRLLIGTSPGEVVRARHSTTNLDPDYLRSYLVLDAPAQGTPYLQVRRIPPGYTAHWRDAGASPQLHPWSGPEVWPVADLRGNHARQAFLDAFDEALVDLAGIPGPLAANLSGGLDSTFVVAGLALQTTAERPVHAFSHAPLAAAGLQARGNWDPDDSGIAATMALAHPGRVLITRLTNEERVQPLDAAAATARRSWLPVFNPGNQVWINQIAERAVQLGAGGVFSGQNGNATFSYDHPYLAPYLLAQGDLRGLLALLDPRTGHNLPLARAIRHRVLGPIRGRLRTRGGRYELGIGLPSGSIPLQHRRAMSRSDWLQWLAPRSPLAAAMCPAGSPAPTRDPFLASRVLAVAAAIDPREWGRGPWPRGYARLLGAGRVPDEIRLRTRRGGQARDTWYVIRNQRDRHLDELRALSDTPVLGGWVKADAVTKLVASWAWDGRPETEPAELIGVHRLLALAQFIRMTDARLNGSPSSFE